MSAQTARIINFPTRPGTEPRLTKAQLASHYQTSQRTIERWMRAGMPAIKSRRTGMVRFLASETDRWHEEG